MIGKTNALSAAGVELSLVVSVTSGAEVTASKSGKTVTGTAAGGSCVLKLPEAGTWSVSATLNGQTSNTQSVSVKDSYAVSLTFFSATITVTVDSGASVALKKDGATVQTKTSTGTAVFTVTGNRHIYNRRHKERAERQRHGQRRIQHDHVRADPLFCFVYAEQ